MSRWAAMGVVAFLNDQYGSKSDKSGPSVTGPKAVIKRGQNCRRSAIAFYIKSNLRNESFALNSRRSQSFFRSPKAELHSAVSNNTLEYHAEIADLDLSSARSNHKLLYLDCCSGYARAKVLGSRRGDKIHVFDPDAVIL